MSTSANKRLPQRGNALSRFASAAAALGVIVTANEPLARHTTFRIGGPADLYVAATTVAQLRTLDELAAEHGVPTTILGGGSNILVSDAGVRGLVIANQTRHCLWPERRRPSATLRLVADSGVMLAGLARAAIKQGLAGLEWAVSVPGTVGGAVIGNAGAHGSDIASNLAWVRVAYPEGEQRTIMAAEMAFAYRTSVLKRQLAGKEAWPVVLTAAFDLVPGEPTELTARANGFLTRRRSSQPTEPSAGSVFRNPAGDYAGRLIESVGLKGHVIGGAQVSPRHANFIVNVGGATATDVKALMALIRQRVFESTGIELVHEILFLGA